MKKFVQILFLWLAGLGLLGHAFIPHHHHNHNNDVCAQDNITNNHSEPDHDHHHHSNGCTHEQTKFEAESKYFAENCADHSHDHEQACSFQNHSFIEKGNTLHAATIINLFVLRQVESKPVNYIIYQAKKAKDNSYLFRSNRAPPVMA